MASELKPCPFCGEPAMRYTLGHSRHRSCEGEYCFVSLVAPIEDMTSEELDAAWNRRAPFRVSRREIDRALVRSATEGTFASDEVVALIREAGGEVSDAEGD